MGEVLKTPLSTQPPNLLSGLPINSLPHPFFIQLIGIEKAFGIFVWINSYFIGTMPGILCQLAVIPVLVLTLMKAKVIPNRYQKVDVIYG